MGKSGKMGDERREMGMEIGRGGDARVDEGKWGDDRWGFAYFRRIHRRGEGRGH